MNIQYIWLLLVFNAIKVAHATWYFQENKICDPGGSNTIPFTGFKINRQYKIAGLLHPVSMHFLVLTHCNHGKVDYSKYIRTESSSSVDWERPFCMFKPKLGDMLTLPPDDTIQNLIDKEVDEEVSKIEIEGTKSLEFKQIVLEKVQTAKKYLRHIFDMTLEKLSSGNAIQYTGKKSYSHHEDIKSADPQSTMEWESRNFACYKMARRRKYAKQKLSFYVPQTFVGGLFECLIPADKRREIFQQFSTSDFIKTLDFECDSSLSKPISPLIAADTTKQWFKNDLLNIFNPALVQTIPYLSTSTSLNIRFSSTNTPDMFGDTWATKIRVNEDYDYSEADIHVISKAVSMTANYLHKLTSPIDFNNLLKNHLNWADESENPSLTVEDSILYKLSKAISSDQKSNLFLSFGQQGIEYLTRIQEIWDTTFGEQDKNNND
ncbi:hypothetical protein DFJ63DRAFT_151335 [Scheffersomyces coipomensis]|uniref:uncharacterized protein n=1 Tax=Scheffersomyces coipomensis TaxID=1788519 RepID=UPI00315DC961